MASSVARGRNSNHPTSARSSRPGTRFVRDNLALVARQRDDRARELEAKLETIELQARSILDLSTPVIQVWDGILVLPLIGSIDTARAEQILQNLLRAVAARGAAVVILDITGVPMIDTAVANHLLETVKATRLLGAKAILAGVSPSIAQTLVRLGIDLTGIDSRAHLQSALALAFTMTGKRVVALYRDVPAPGRDRP
jgi:rsbT co-antagonist protein RsbR